MKTSRKAIAAAELALIFPAALFMTALFVREIQPQQYQPAHTAAQIVNWYAASPRIGLWLLLIAMPLGVLVTGGITLITTWASDAEVRHAARQMLTSMRAQLATLSIAFATLTAAGILAIVALHIATD